MNILLARVGLFVAGLALIFTSGYLTGRHHGRVATLQAAVQAYKLREKINHETNNLNAIALCRALGGMRAECADLMRGLDKAPSNQ